MAAKDNPKVATKILWFSVGLMGVGAYVGLQGDYLIGGCFLLAGIFAAAIWDWVAFLEKQAEELRESVYRQTLEMISIESRVRSLETDNSELKKQMAGLVAICEQSQKTCGSPMFTWNELCAGVQCFVSMPAPPMEVVKAESKDSSEQTAWAFKGDKKDFSSVVQFWVKGVQEGWGGDEECLPSSLMDGLCRPITSEMFWQEAGQGRGLFSPVPLFLDSEQIHVRRAMLMINEWNDVGVIAEADQHFIAFFWTTTA